MKQNTRIGLAAFVFVCLTGTVAQAACVVEYKAKSDNPLNLVFETTQVSGPCTAANAAAQLKPALAARGLTLLKVVSVRQQ